MRQTALAILFMSVAGASAALAQPVQSAGLNKIRHIVIIMQENHSFDNYFGSFPGANGIPSGVCVPDPKSKTCVRPFTSASAKNVEGPHSHQAAILDIDGGKMDGFIAAAERLGKKGRDARAVMRTHTQAEIPNYWAYARHFVLQDNLFSSASSWSLPAHLYMVSAWSAQCRRGNPMSCKSDLDQGHEKKEDLQGDRTGRNVIVDCHSDSDPECEKELRRAVRGLSRQNAARLQRVIGARCQPANTQAECAAAIAAFAPSLPLLPRLLVKRSLAAPIRTAQERDFPWTDVTWLLHRQGVSWKYYLFEGNEPDCRDDDDVVCPPHRQRRNTPGMWNPLPSFDTVNRDDEVRNVRPIREFYEDARLDRLPAVSWVIPSAEVSEHAPNSIAAGQAYVTGLLDTLMRSPAWSSSAIFVSWDDWGGFYDHVRPPAVDENGYGLRVPGLVIGPYAKAGVIDHQLLSHDAYLRFIEDVFLGGARLDPATDGRPDPRPTVRENLTGDLARDFDFRQAPRAPFLLPGGKVFY